MGGSREEGPTKAGRPAGKEEVLGRCCPGARSLGAGLRAWETVASGLQGDEDKLLEVESGRPTHGWAGASAPTVPSRTLAPSAGLVPQARELSGSTLNFLPLARPAGPALSPLAISWWRPLSVASLRNRPCCGLPPTVVGDRLVEEPQAVPGEEGTPSSALQRRAQRRSDSRF